MHHEPPCFFLLLLAPAIHFYFSFCSSTPLYDFWLWLGVSIFSFLHRFLTKNYGFFFISIQYFHIKPSLSVLCMFPFHSLSLSLSLLTTIPNYTPPLLPITSFFIFFSFFQLSLLYSLHFFLQIPHDNFNLSKYARELFFFFFLSFLFLFFLSSCLLS